MPGGDLDWAEATFDSPFGRISSAWRIEPGPPRRFLLDVEVPPGTRAEVVLPDGKHTTAAPGRHHYACTLDR
jgi:alpha-L-rhamnosidase